MLMKTVPAKAGTVVFGAGKTGISRALRSGIRLMNAEQKKQQAAIAALVHVEENTVIGVGTGSTVNHFIDALAAQKLRIRGAVSSSERSTARLRAAGFEVLDLNTTGELDLYIDGADESECRRRLIKGGGGALTREKIVAAA